MWSLRVRCQLVDSTQLLVVIELQMPYYLVRVYTIWSTDNHSKPILNSLISAFLLFFLRQCKCNRGRTCGAELARPASGIDSEYSNKDYRVEIERDCAKQLFYITEYDPKNG